jgi:hypothetical protein
MRYYYRPGHPKANERGFVSGADLNEYEAPQALNAPILMDRFYENTCATDGTDIGSRRKHRDYMRRNNVTVASDFAGTWDAAAREREAIRKGENDRRERREQVERAMHRK